jgi:beta-glucosidase-like glycosyl hydrolase
VRELAQLLLPSVRWEAAHGFEAARSNISRALENGVGGFVVESGPREAIAALTADIRRHAGTAPILVVDMQTLAAQAWRERPFPVLPLAAIASLRDPMAIRRAARAIAREAKAAGCNALLAPNCDVPLVARSNAFGGHAPDVAGYVAEWIDAAQAEGVMCIAGDFPGEGRLDETSSVPIVRDSDDALYAFDLVPYRAAIDSGVAGIRISDAAFPGLDSSGAPAPLSPTIVTRLLRRELGFDGFTVADATSLATRRGRAIAIADMISAGVDLVVRPPNADVELRALIDAFETRRIDRERVHEAARRARARAEMAGSPSGLVDLVADDDAWLDDLAERTITVVRGRSVRIVAPIEVVVVGAPASSGSEMVDAVAAGIGEAGGDPLGVRLVGAPGAGLRAALVVVAVPGQGVGMRLRSIETEAARSGRSTVLVWCGHPSALPPLGDDPLIVAAWTADTTMLRAAGRWLLKRM